MPLYDYKCNACDEVYEKTVKIAEMNDPQECPYCGSMDSQKFIGGAPLLGDASRLDTTRKKCGGWKEVLQKINSTPGSRLRETSNYDF